jgi:hypothetical protein
MAIVPLLQGFVDDELALAPALVARVRMGTAQLLGPSTGAGMSLDERSHHADLAQALQRDAALYESTFTASLRRLVAAEMHASERSHPDEGEAKRAAGGLELMDESRVEVDIEISRAMQLIDGTAEWELRELQTFTSTLAGQRHVTAESNPFRPLVYATALWDAACAISSSQVQRAIVLRNSAGVTAGLLKNAWAAASTRLESKGVEPGIYRTVVLPGASVARGPADASRPLLPPALLSRLPRPADPRRGNGGAMATGSDSPESRIAGLVNGLFESILLDSQLPDAFHPMVELMQAPARRAAQLEPAVLESYAHPLWRLLDRIAEVSLGYPRPDDARLRAFHTFCHAVAQEIAASAAPDTNLFRWALNRIESFLWEQLQSQLRTARPSVDALDLAERREVLQQHLVQRLTDQMVSFRTSPTVRRFVTGTWARVIAAEMLAHGEQSEAALGALKTADDLLWSLRIPDHPQSRQRLVALLPDLLQRLHAGMETIALATDDQQRVLSELMAIHTEALRPGARTGGTTGPGALTPEEIVKRMREEVVPETAPRRSFSDSVIDLSSMETVPAEHLPASTDGADDDRAKRIDDLRLGERQRIFLQGRWSCVQLLWRSDRGLFYLFAGESSTRPQSITRRALERLGAAGLVQALEAKPLVQRGIERMTRDLSPRS